MHFAPDNGGAWPVRSTRLHIAHANGFPGQVYQPLARHLDTDVFALPMVGHDPAFPVNNEWDALVDQLIAYLSTESPDQKVFLVGHSLGAILSFRVAHARPDLVSGLLMLDPPLIYGVSAWAARLARVVGKTDEFTPARLSKHRRRHWNSWQEVETYFQKKAFYKQLNPEVYEAWMQCGVIESATGYELAFSVDTEVEIFRTTPLYLNRLQGRLQVPAWLLYADDSDACWRHCVEPFAKKFGVNVDVTKGGHMFPLINLEATAAVINRHLREIAV